MRSRGAPVLRSVLLWAAALVIVAATLGTSAGIGATEAAAQAGATDTSASERDGIRRVFVYVIPDVSWAELRDNDAPALRAFVADAAIANLAAARTVPHRAGPADAYLTFGAGTRAVGDPPEDGQVLAPDAEVYGVSAAALYERRTGRMPRGALVSVNHPSIVRENESKPYDADLGLVGRELAQAGVAASVVGNADGSASPADVAGLHREVALTFADADGQVERGVVGTVLLRRDASAPFAVRLDRTEVARAFAGLWEQPGRSVVVVEASDLTRVQRAPRVPDREGERAELRARALRDSDRIFARLMERVSIEDGDAVMVLGLPTAYAGRGLGVAALRTPNGESGWLRSASTQRDGVVSTVDLGPTLLDLFGLSAGAEVEGRAARVTPSSDSYTTREDRLIADAHGAAFRSSLLFDATVGMLALLILMSIVVFTVLELRDRRGRGVARFVCAVTVSYLPATYLVQLVPGHSSSVGVYFLIVACISVALASIIVRLPGGSVATVAAGAAIALGVLMIDALTGTHMQFNAVFGYSPAANSRLYGLGNYALGQIMAGALVLAALLVWRGGVPRGRAIALALLGCVLVVIGMPFWGADVGGVLAGTPTFLLFAVLVWSERVQWKRLALAFAATAPAIALFALVDLARPASSRTHLGRLVERILHDGFAPLGDVVGRKLVAAYEASADSFWIVSLPFSVGFILMLTYARGRPLQAWRIGVRPLRVAVVSCALGAFLGSALNDSGAVVASVLAATLAPLLGILALESAPTPPEPEPSGESDLPGEPDAPDELEPGSGAARPSQVDAT